MGGEVKQCRIKIHNEILKLRSLERILKSDSFENSYRNSSDEEKNKLDWILKSQHLNNLKLWIFKINEQSLETMSSRKLRELCKKYSVPYWSRLDKLEMIGELKHATSVG